MNRQLHIILVFAGILQLVGLKHAEPVTNGVMSMQIRIQDAQTRLAKLKALVAAHPDAAKDDYVRLGILVAEHFTTRMKTSGPDGKQTDGWTSLQADEVKTVLDATELRIKIISSKKIKPLMVPKPTGGPITIRDGIFYTDIRIAKNSPAVKRPIFFYGYGVFKQTADDMLTLKDMGVTLISQERGPSTMHPDGSMNDDGNRITIVDTLKSAAKYGIKVDLLLSPHYFPQWAIDKSPDIIPTENSGFPNLNINHPKTREVLRKWLETIIPAVKDEPALFSVCLANEPTSRIAGREPYSRPKWIAYLKQKHQSIEALNDLYGTGYTSFEDVPPGTQPVSDTGSKRAYYDWVRFNQISFAEWFQWMNDIIKELAPNLPTHIKVNAPIFFVRQLVMDSGVDPELLSRITDIAGNDCEVYSPEGGSYPHDKGVLDGSFAYNWQVQELWYDLLHSFKGQPVFNSENHFIVDNSPAVTIPPNHTRAVLWQGALHHGAASTLWLWEEPRETPFMGSIYIRPANMFAAGRTMLDMNRLAPELAAINQSKPKIALLYSMPSVIWEENYFAGQQVGDKLDTVKKMYTALTFLGQPVTFISERQLAEGTGAKVDWIIVPNATHVEDSTIKALDEFAAKGGNVLLAGKNSLLWDEYERPRELPIRLASAPRVDPAADDKTLMANLGSALMKDGTHLTSLYDVKDSQHTWGVEYRLVPFRNGILVPMTN
ncbi:MAG: beta-galactosidase, partial [Armatimonadota bacterium]